MYSMVGMVNHATMNEKAMIAEYLHLACVTIMGGKTGGTEGKRMISCCKEQRNKHRERD